MNKTQIDARLLELKKKEQLIRSELEHKKIKYNKNEWFTSSRVQLLEDRLLTEDNSDHCYVSFLETNNSFAFPPKKPIFKNLLIYKQVNIHFAGEISGECEVRLVAITYLEKEKKSTYSISLNSNTEIPIDCEDGMRLALRIQGNGSFKLTSLTIEPIHKVSPVASRPIAYPLNISKQEKKLAKKVKVAMIVDEFTYESFRHECDAVYLSPDNWLETMQLERPDIFFCESAWSGKDPDKREWRGKIYSSINFKHENRKELLQIIQYCNENGIKTVFWNKEDPSHYEDSVHNFVDTAKKFDIIFTTAEECVDRYKNEYHHRQVYPLMFAVQPKQFNPIETFERSNDFIFAGSYYKQHPQRCGIMDAIFKNIVDLDADKLVIYDRQSNNDDPNHQFPDEFQPHIRQRLPYTQLDKAYKGSKFAININTETNSTTMFARRVFELMASNTLVVSNYSAGLDKHFGDLMYLLRTENSEDDRKVLEHAISIDSERQRLKALRHVLTNHTYEERMNYVLNIAGIAVEPNITNVCAIIFINNEAELIEAIDVFESQNYINKQLLLINRSDNHIETAEWLSKYGGNAVCITDMHMINKYGKQINDFISAQFVAFLSLDMYYGCNYLLDMLLSYKYLDTDTIVVKQVSSPSYRYTNSGHLFASILPKEALKRIEVGQIEATKDVLVGELFKIGYRIFNCDPYNVLLPQEITENNKVKITI